MNSTQQVTDLRSPRIGITTGTYPETIALDAASRLICDHRGREGITSAFVVRPSRLHRAGGTPAPQVVSSRP